MAAPRIPGSALRAHPFDDHLAAIVADAIGGAAGDAPFRLPGGAVYQVTVPDPDGRPTTLLTLWPTLRRVDVISSHATVVFTNVTLVETVGAIEVQFRRSTGELLIVARGGKVMVRA